MQSIAALIGLQIIVISEWTDELCRWMGNCVIAIAMRRRKQNDAMHLGSRWMRGDDEGVVKVIKFKFYCNNSLRDLIAFRSKEE